MEYEFENSQNYWTFRAIIAFYPNATITRLNVHAHRPRAGALVAAKRNY